MRKPNVKVELGKSIMSNQWQEQFVSLQATLISLFDTANILSANQSLIPFQKITFIIFTRLWSQSLIPKFNIYTDVTLSLFSDSSIDASTSNLAGGHWAWRLEGIMSR